MTSDLDLFSESLTVAAQSVLDTLYRIERRFSKDVALDHFGEQQAKLIKQIVESTDEGSATFQAAYTMLVGSYIAYGVYVFSKQKDVKIDAKFLPRDKSSERKVDLSDWGN